MQDEMDEATRLTRSGRLAEATALIQRPSGRGGPAGLWTPARSRVGYAPPPGDPAPGRVGAARPGGSGPGQDASRRAARAGVPGRVVTGTRPGPAATSCTCPRGRRAGRAAGGDAARLHPDGGRLRRRDPHERAGRAGTASWSPTPSRRPRPTSGAAGTGSCRPTSAATPASRPCWPASPARSWRPTRSTRAGCSWPGSRPAGPWPPCWPRPTRTCTPPPGSTPASPTGPPTTCQSAYAAMRQGPPPGAEGPGPASP